MRVRYAVRVRYAEEWFDVQHESGVQELYEPDKPVVQFKLYQDCRVVYLIRAG